jgi:hypothetical protein
MRKNDGTQDTLLSLRTRRRSPGQSLAVSVREGALQPQQFGRSRPDEGPRRWQAETGCWVELSAVRDPGFSDVDNPTERPRTSAKPYFG